MYARRPMDKLRQPKRRPHIYNFRAYFFYHCARLSFTSNDLGVLGKSGSAREVGGRGGPHHEYQLTGIVSYADNTHSNH